MYVIECKSVADTVCCVGYWTHDFRIVPHMPQARYCAARGENSENRLYMLNQSIKHPELNNVSVLFLSVRLSNVCIVFWVII
jgi:hypothetical protein